MDGASLTGYKFARGHPVVYFYYFYCTFIVVLSWPEDGRSRPKHVVKYHLIVIIASCLIYVVY